MPVPPSVEAEFDQWLNDYAEAWEQELRTKLSEGAQEESHETEN